MFEQPRKKEAASKASPLTGLHLELFNELREVRRGIAENRHVPPYVIFSDATLTHLALKLPKDGSELRAISGIGEVKARDFGSEFLGAIRIFVNKHPELRPSESVVTPEVKRYAGGTAELSRQLFEAGRSIQEIAQERHLSTATVINHLSGFIASGTIADIGRLVDPEKLAAIRKAFAELGYDTLTPVREQLGPDYSWDELKIARLLVQHEVVQ
jgi:ATP-dependent DNA helicase RecQ